MTLIIFPSVLSSFIRLRYLLLLAYDYLHLHLHNILVPHIYSKRVGNAMIDRSINTTHRGKLIAPSLKPTSLQQCAGIQIQNIQELKNFPIHSNKSSPVAAPPAK